MISPETYIQPTVKISTEDDDEKEICFVTIIRCFLYLYLCR